LLSPRATFPADHNGGFSRRHSELEKRLRELEASDPDASAPLPNYATLRRASRDHDVTLIDLHSTEITTRGTHPLFTAGWRTPQ
jgi:hypothetical protein